jgi:hypothetical protein
MLKVKFGPVQKWVQFVPQAGEDDVPPVGSLVAIIESHELLFAAASYDNVPADPNMVTGEKKIYATDGNGNALGYIYLKNDGKLSIGNVGYNLATALTNLIQGIQGATFGGYPCVDATTKIATALIQLQGLLE